MLARSSRPIVSVEKGLGPHPPAVRGGGGLARASRLFVEVVPRPATSKRSSLPLPPASRPHEVKSFLPRSRLRGQVRGVPPKGEVARVLERRVVAEAAVLPGPLRRRVQGKRPLQHAMGRVLPVTVQQKSVTESAQVGKPVRYQYDQIFERWVLEMEVSDRDLLDAVVTDGKLVEFFDQCYLGGQGPSAGNKLLAALHFHRPEFSRWGELRTPRAAQALKGWAKLCPGKTKRPWPWVVVAAIACVMAWLGYPDMARYWVLMVDTFGRPSEILRLMCRQVIPPVRCAGTVSKVCVHLHPDYYGIRSKTAELDDSVLVDRLEVSDLMAEWVS